MKLSATKSLDFNLALQGVEAEKPVTIPWLVSVGDSGVETPVVALVHALGMDAEGRAAKFAETWAEEHGRMNARRGDEFYDQGFAMAAVAEAYVDPESPKEKREPFIADPRELAGMLPARLAFLYDHLELQQSLVSPFTHEMSYEEVIAMAVEVANTRDDAPFIGMSPGMRAICFRGVATLLVGLLGHKSPSTLSSPQVADPKA